MTRITFLCAIAASCLATGCSLDEPEKITGALCGSEAEPLKGLLGSNSLAHVQEFDAGQNAKYALLSRCPEGYDFCVHPQAPGEAEDKSAVLCSKCAQGQLLCDTDVGGKKCVSVLNDNQNCGACNNRCGNGFCSNGVCVDPNAEATCGATTDNPKGKKCRSDRKCVDQICQCSSGTDCNGGCVDLNSNETCGTSCDSIMKCSTEERQQCQLGSCVCPEGLLLREGHCIDPMRNNKYCGANDEDNLNGEKCNLSKNLRCNHGKCGCMNGYTQTKDDLCVDVQTNNDYCGAVPDALGQVDYNRCMEHATCVGGKCVCDAGYHSIGNACEANTDEQCGARGYANSSDPTDENYKGYYCGQRTKCESLNIPIKKDGSIQYEQISACKYVEAPLSQNSSEYLYDARGNVLAVSDTRIFSSCSKSNSGFNSSLYYNSCSCKSGLSGDLCQEIQDKCELNGTKCENNSVCKISSFGNPYCDCPDGSIAVTDGEKTTCIAESNANCGAENNRCDENEFCENGTCKSCGYNQLFCEGVCLDNYDYDSKTGQLSSFADRHITGCETKTDGNGMEIKTLICEEGYGRCDHSSISCGTSLTTNFNCGKCGNKCGNRSQCVDGVCCLEADKEYTELYIGEYDNAKCCDESASRKCVSASIGEDRIIHIYACRTQCFGYEKDLTGNE